MNWYDRENEKRTGCPLSRLPEWEDTIDPRAGGCQIPSLIAQCRLEETLLAYDRLRAENDVIRQDYNRLFDDLDKQLKENEDLKQQQEAVAREAWMESGRQPLLACAVRQQMFNDWWQQKQGE